MIIVGLALGVFCSEHAAFTSREQVVDAGRAVLPGYIIHHLEREWGVWYALGGTGAIVAAMTRLLDELGAKSSSTPRSRRFWSTRAG